MDPSTYAPVNKFSRQLNFPDDEETPTEEENNLLVEEDRPMPPDHIMDIIKEAVACGFTPSPTRKPPPILGPTSSPGLRPHHRPLTLHHAGPPPSPRMQPQSAGPVAQQLNSVADKMASYMCHKLKDVIADVPTQGNPEATIKGLHMEMEKMKRHHQKEIDQVKHDAVLAKTEMRQSMEVEMQCDLMDARVQSEINKKQAILETKKKQLCAACRREATINCCWNTSYCDYRWQQAHRQGHMAPCTQEQVEGREQCIGGINELGDKIESMMFKGKNLTKHSEGRETAAYVCKVW